MADTSVFDDIKSKITWRNKTIYGSIVILLGLILSLINSNTYPIFIMIIWFIPAICLVIPDGTFKNNRTFGFICLIFDLIVFCAIISTGLSNIVPALYALLLIVAGYMMTVKTENDGSSGSVENSSSSFKNKITSENKTVFGAILIVLGLIAFGICPAIGILSVLVISIPAICLVIPSETLKNSKVLGIILILLLVFIIFLCINGISTIEHELNQSMVVYAGDYDGIYAFYIQIFLSVLNIVGAFLMTIPTVKKGSSQIENNVSITETKSESNNSSQVNFCKYCGAKLDKDSKFCASCGEEL